MSAPVIRVENVSKLYRLGKRNERADTMGRMALAPMRLFEI